MRRQGQSGGDESVNIQAHNDVNLHVGTTPSEVREIALDVFKANILELRGIAEDVASARAEKITRDFVEALQARNPAGLSSIQDPDMQVSIYNAQKGYACSGEEDLEAALIDLLVDRAGQTRRDLKTLVLNQAIECIPRLTEVQRKALAVSFVVRHTAHPVPPILPAFYFIITGNLAPFADISSLNPIDLQYAQSTGVGAVTQFQFALEDAFWHTYCGFLSKGFSSDQTEAQLRANGAEDSAIRTLMEDGSTFIPCSRNPELLQINAVSMDDVKRLQIAKGVAPRPGHAGPFEALCQYGRMSAEEIKEDVVSHVPAMSQLFEHWSRSGLKGFELTAIGITIGHSYWRHTTGSEALLDIWL